MLLLLTHAVIVIGVSYTLSYFLHLLYLITGLHIQQTLRT